MFNNKKLKVLLLMAFLCAPVYIYAQPGFDDDVLDAPIDGGSSILIAAAVAYGWKKKKMTIEENENQK